MARKPSTHHPATSPYNVRPCDNPYTIRPRVRGAKAAGLRYERKAAEWFAREFPISFLGQWFSFEDSGDETRRVRHCQVDAFALDPIAGVVTVCEIKLKHTPESWWQLVHLYSPVLAVLFPRPHWRFRLVELCCWFDISTRYPSDFTLLRSIHSEHTGIGVHIRRM